MLPCCNGVSRVDEAGRFPFQSREVREALRPPNGRSSVETPEGLRLPLMAHQRQALAWMIEREERKVSAVDPQDVHPPKSCAELQRLEAARLREMPGLSSTARRALAGLETDRPTAIPWGTVYTSSEVDGVVNATMQSVPFGERLVEGHLTGTCEEVDGRTTFTPDETTDAPHDWASVASRPLRDVAGGILADEMGLGKTITTFALVLARPAVLTHSDLRILTGAQRSPSEVLSAMRAARPAPLSLDAAALATKPPQAEEPSAAKPTVPGLALHFDEHVETQTECQRRQARLMSREDSKVGEFMCICHMPSWAVLADQADDGAAAPLAVSCTWCGISQHAACTHRNRPEGYAHVCAQCCDALPLLPGRGTLVVAPEAILGQWMDEASRVLPDGLTMAHYQGVGTTRNGIQHPQPKRKRLAGSSKKSKAPATPAAETHVQREPELVAGRIHKLGPEALDPRWIAQFDVVFVSYETLAKDIHSIDSRTIRASKRHRARSMHVSCPLTRIRWWRLYADEAQQVDRETRGATKVIRKLPAVNRWCVTGTPMNHSVNDLHGLFAFLRVPYVGDPRWWREHIELPLSRGCFQARNRLGRCLRSYGWGNPASAVELPRQTIRTIGLALTPVERVFYDDHARAGRDAVINVAEGILEAALERQGVPVHLAALLSPHIARKQVPRLRQLHAATRRIEGPRNRAKAEGALMGVEQDQIDHICSEVSEASVSIADVGRVLSQLTNLSKAAGHPRIVDQKRTAGAARGGETAAAPPMNTLGDVLTSLIQGTQRDIEECTRVCTMERLAIAGLQLLLKQHLEARHEYTTALSTESRIDVFQRLHALRGLACACENLPDCAEEGRAATQRADALYDRLLAPSGLRRDAAVAQWRRLHASVAARASGLPWITEEPEETGADATAPPAVEWWRAVLRATESSGAGDRLVANLQTAFESGRLGDRHTRHDKLDPDARILRVALHSDNPAVAVPQAIQAVIESGMMVLRAARMRIDALSVRLAGRPTKQDVLVRSSCPRCVDQKSEPHPECPVCTAALMVDALEHALYMKELTTTKKKQAASKLGGIRTPHPSILMVSLLAVFSRQADLVELSDAELTHARAFGAWLADFQSEVSALRMLWRRYTSLVNEMDELRQAQLRLQHPGTVPGDAGLGSENFTVVPGMERAKVVEHQTRFAAAQADLAKLHGRLRYLQGLGRAEENGQASGSQREGATTEVPVSKDCIACLEPLPERIVILPCAHRTCPDCWAHWVESRPGRSLQCMECKQVVAGRVLEVDNFLQVTRAAPAEKSSGSAEDGSQPAASAKPNAAEGSKPVPAPVFAGPELHAVLGPADYARAQDLTTEPLVAFHGTKVDAVVRLLSRIQARGARAVVFSKFVLMLELLVEACRLNHVSVIFPKGRSKAFSDGVMRFRGGHATALLMPYKSGAEGLNLTEADNVVLVDPTSAAQEDQAIGRIRRIGQAKQTTVYRFLVSDTVEVRIRQLALSVAGYALESGDSGDGVGSPAAAAAAGASAAVAARDHRAGAGAGDASVRAAGAGTGRDEESQDSPPSSLMRSTSHSQTTGGRSLPRQAFPVRSLLEFVAAPERTYTDPMPPASGEGRAGPSGV